MRDRQPTEPERTWIDDLLGSPGVRDTLRDGNTVQIDAQWGGESTASGTATGENPNLDLGGVSGDGGGSVQTLERLTEGVGAEIPVAIGGLVFLAVAGWMLYRGQFRGAAIFGTLGAFVVGGLFWWPLWVLAALLGAVVIVLFYPRLRVAVARKSRAFGDLVTVIDKDPALKARVMEAMQGADAEYKAEVKKARADAAKRKGR